MSAKRALNDKRSELLLGAKHTTISQSWLSYLNRKPSTFQTPEEYILKEIFKYIFTSMHNKMI